MFIGEHKSGTVTELESRDVNFLENKFPNIKEVDKDFQFYELENPNKVITYNVGVGTSVNPSGIATLSGSQTPDISIQLRNQLRRVVVSQFLIVVLRLREKLL